MINRRILIVEDEQIIAENIKFILNENGYKDVEIAIDEQEARNIFAIKPFDLVLMDINLNEFSDSDGIDLIHDLAIHYSFEHIYITANADSKTVKKAKSSYPSGFIVKPFTNASVYANVEVALEKINDCSAFTYSENGINKSILISNIVLIKSDGAYIVIHTKDGDKTIIRYSISTCADVCPNKLVRIHKSIVVNLDYIDRFSNSYVVINESKYTIGRSFKEKFLSKASVTV